MEEVVILLLVSLLVLFSFYRLYLVWSIKLNFSEVRQEVKTKEGYVSDIFVPGHT